MSLSDRPSVASADPATRPLPLFQRLRLLFILLVLPMAAVTLPTLAITGIFGQRPKPKTPAAHAKPVPPKPSPLPAKPTPTPDTSGLRAALDHSAVSLLPTPAPLSPDTIRLTVTRAEHLDARAEKVAGQARLLGGAAVSGVAAAGERHLFVDLPAGRAEAFRQAVTRNEPPVLPAGTPAAGTARDQLEVLIRPAADDE